MKRAKYGPEKIRDFRPVSRPQAQMCIRDSYYIKQGLSSRNEDLFYMTVLITVSAPTLDELQWRKQQMTDLMKSCL